MDDDRSSQSDPEALAAAIRYIEREARAEGYELTARLLGAAAQAVSTEMEMATKQRHAIVVELADYRSPPKS